MPTVAELEKRLDRNDERFDALENNHNGLSEKIIKLDAKMEVYNNDVKRMAEKLTEVAADVKIIMLKPAKSWDSTKTTIISVVIGLVVGFVFNHFLT